MGRSDPGYRCQGPELCLPGTLLKEEMTESVHVGRACKYLTNITQREQWYFLLLPGLEVEAKHWSK